MTPLALLEGLPINHREEDPKLFLLHRPDRPVLPDRFPFPHRSSHLMELPAALFVRWKSRFRNLPINIPIPKCAAAGPTWKTPEPVPDNVTVPSLLKLPARGRPPLRSKGLHLTLGECFFTSRKKDCYLLPLPGFLSMGPIERRGRSSSEGTEDRQGDSAAAICLLFSVSEKLPFTGPPYPAARK